MRARAVALAALLAAACQVDVDGAPCAGPGTTSDCPGGQACGNDLRCSARALACVASRCTPGESIRSTTRPDTAVRCETVDPVCGRWVEDDCRARGLVCPEGATACICPEYAGTVVVADRRSSAVRGAPPYPTGQPDAAPECRFGRLGDALAAAGERFPAAATVRVEGEPGGSPVFGAETGEEWPLAIGAAVAVVAAAPQWPPIFRGAPGLAAPVVAAQGALEDVRIEGAGATGAGIAISCGAAPSLRRVGVDGGGTFDPGGAVTGGLSTGVAISGACGARLQAVDVSGVSGPALAIDPAAAATVDVLGGSYRASTVGIRIRGGKVTIAPDPDTAASVVVSGNAREGIVVGGIPASTTPVDVSFNRLAVFANGGTGVVIHTLVSASRVAAFANDIVGNGNVSASLYGSGGGRPVGGVLVALAPITSFAFGGNRIGVNAGDQLAFESSAPWSIAPVECGEQTNNFFDCAGSETDSCVFGGRCALSVVGGGSVNARYNRWPGAPAASHVSAGVTDVAAPFLCADTQAGVPATPACPAP